MRSEMNEFSNQNSQKSSITLGKLNQGNIPSHFFERENLKSFLLCFLNLAIVIGAGNVAWIVDRVEIYILCFILVGARAQSLYILQHECMHWLLFSQKKMNDYVGMIISGILGTVLYTGRLYHFKHHRELGMATDPNEVWHGTNDKKPGVQTTLYFAGQLFGGRVFKSLAGLLIKKQSSGEVEVSEKKNEMMKIDLIVLLAVQGFIFLLFCFVSSPFAYFLFFIGPIVTLTAFFEAVRSFSEHVLPGQVPTNIPEELRLFYMKSNLLERFFISQFYFNYHHLHHIYPNIVTFKMKELHSYLLLNDPTYPNKFIERSSYLGVLKNYILNQSIAGAGKLYPLKKDF